MASSCRRCVGSGLAAYCVIKWEGRVPSFSSAYSVYKEPCKEVEEGRATVVASGMRLGKAWELCHELITNPPKPQESSTGTSDSAASTGSTGQSDPQAAPG